MDLQYHFQAGTRHDIVAGAGYRLIDQAYREGYGMAFGDGRRRDSLVSTLIQDEVKPTPTVSLTLGSKVEHNAYTEMPVATQSRIQLPADEDWSGSVQPRHIRPRLGW